jgi:site-specific DNA-methyltransferase (adenine-specific)
MIIIGDALTELKKLESKSINCCVTSPPYFGLRDYGHEKQIGLEQTPDQFVQILVDVFREVSRVLKDDGTLWLNLGDSYAGNHGHKQSSGAKSKSNKGSLKNDVRIPGPGLKQKDLIGIPWKVAFALQADGWYLRQDIIWHKPNPMPESVKDRCTKAHEYIFLLSKSPRYYFDHEAIKEPVQSNKGNANSFRGGCYVNGNLDNSTMGKRTVSGNTKKRPSVKRGGFNGKTEAMAGTGQNAFRAVTDTRNKRDIWTIEDHNSLIQWLSETNPEILKQYLDVNPDVWTVSTKPYKGAHFATFPPDLIEPCIISGCPPSGLVLDPFFGSGTVGQVARETGRDFIGIELNPEYKPLIDDRISKAHYQNSF